jgi:LuxR family maltose regulon positive regulatory protein
MLQALAHHAGGDHVAAVATLDRALAEAPEADHHVRLFLDEGPPMLDLLRDVAGADDPTDRRTGRGERDEVETWAARLLGRARRPVAGPAAQPSLADPLSPRELEVLRLLDSELTGPQIAAELYVSLNTLRTHTKRIFTKLDVSTRAAAVRRAREHGLL